VQCHARFGLEAAGAIAAMTRPAGLYLGTHYRT